MSGPERREGEADFSHVSSQCFKLYIQQHSSGISVPSNTSMELIGKFTNQLSAAGESLEVQRMGEGCEVAFANSRSIKAQQRSEPKEGFERSCCKFRTSCGDSTKT